MHLKTSSFIIDSLALSPRKKKKINSPSSSSRFKQTVETMSDEEDFFYEEEIGSSQRRCHDGHELDSGLAAAESTASANRHRLLGYHESYDQSKEVRLQEGFEDGFRKSFDTAVRIGSLLGRHSIQSHGEEKGEQTGQLLHAARLARSRLIDITSTPNSDKLQKLEKDLTEILTEESKGREGQEGDS